MIKPEVDLKVLYYFTVLARERHFGLAAKQIGIEQPPLSLQIKKLEKIVGAQLFDRSSRQIKLTAIGEALLPEAIALVEKSHALLENIRNVSRGEAGILNIGFATSTSFCGIPTIIQKFKKSFPKVALNLRELSSGAQINELTSGKIDIGFMREAKPTNDIISKEIITEEFVAVMSHQHPLSSKEMISFKDLRDEPFVHFPKHVAPALYNRVNELFAAARFTPNIVQEALEWQTIISLVEANLGVSICPASFQKLKIGKVHYKPLSNAKVKTRISICYNSKMQSNLIKAFLHMVNDHFEKLER
ncbi:MAG TPA: LysR family transcriptional regulator [Flavisolibacter sp.]|jgi:DNA-binding transcriptional LysR family regulator|nr:LysR family transcriptional regulator [Flavisolibacter sp.]HZI00935.1 LysR family transcriptional regulator [Flavisolibacter sp.]